MSVLRRAATAALALGFVATACSAADSDETTRDENGAVVESGDVGVFAIQVGDCFGDLGTGEISAATAVPCADPHLNEVYALFDMPDGDFPGDAAITTAWQEGCLERFDAFVGLDFASSIYDITPLTPTATSWAQGDREIVCMVQPVSGENTTGTAKGSGL